MSKADDRMDEVLSQRVDPTNRGQIARHRHELRTEANRNRTMIADLAHSVTLREDGPAVRRMSNLKQAVYRLEKLLVRVETLDAMTAALDARDAERAS